MSAQCVELNFLSSAVDKKTLIRIGVSILPFYSFKLLKWNVNEVKSQNGQRVCTRNKANKTSFLSVMGEKERLDNDVPDNLATPRYKHLITSLLFSHKHSKDQVTKNKIFTRWTYHDNCLFFQFCHINSLPLLKRNKARCYDTVNLICSAMFHFFILYRFSQG